MKTNYYNQAKAWQTREDAAVIEWREQYALEHQTMRLSVAFRIVMSNLEKKYPEKDVSSKKSGFLPMALSCLEPWPGLGVR